LSYEMMKPRERRLSLMAERNMCSVGICETLSTRRGRRAHHAQMDRVGTWEIPLAVRPLFALAVRIGKARSRSR